MKIIKKQKVLQIFSNGSLNFCCKSFFSPKDSQLIFYEKDFKNSFSYKKKDQRIVVSDGKNLIYRKKYVVY